MDTLYARVPKFSSVFLRIALGTSFLSAVADRFGLWGAYGQSNVSWGNYARFVDYTAKLNWFLPPSTIPALANIATAAEILFGILLFVGWQTRITALLRRSSSGHFWSGDDGRFGSQGRSQFLGFFGCGRSAAVGNLYKVSLQPG